MFSFVIRESRKEERRLTSRGETVLGLVSEGDDLLLVLELGNDDDGSEDLLLEDGVLGVNVGEDSLREGREVSVETGKPRCDSRRLTGSM